MYSKTMSPVLMFVFFLLGSLMSAHVFGSAPAQQGDPPNDVKAEIAAVYAMTKTAASAKEYGEIIDRCQTLENSESLVESDGEYVRKLASWAYNRRCESRMESAEWIRLIGNESQAALVADDAFADCLAAIQRDPQRWRSRLNRGILLGNNGMFHEALVDFDYICETQPNQSAGWYNAGEANLAIRDFDAALHCLNKAVELSPGDLQALTARGHANYAKGEYQAAWRDFDAVVRMSPGQFEATINRGDALLAMGRTAEAYDDFVAAAKVAKCGRATTRAAWLLATSAEADFYRPESAAAMAQEAIQTDGENRFNLEALAAAQAASGDFPAAIESQKRAIELAAADADVQMKNRLEMYQANRPYVFSVAYPTTTVEKPVHEPDSR